MIKPITVDNVSKCYVIGESRRSTLRDALSAMWRHQIRRQQRPQRTVKWALDGVSLEIGQGEIIGLIGKNGAGKSTLLKILSRITYPTTGTVKVNGRVGSLLEVGTGFHDELTGRENIYLNGSILGLRKVEIDAALDQIIEFAEIGDYIDVPIKRYSSGMRMRLGFAVAAHLRTDVLFVDEVLAVGDAGFQKKCLGTMRELGKTGRTVVFVSHSMASIQQLCHRSIWIADGALKHDGNTNDVVEAYLASYGAVGQQTLDLATVTDRSGTGAVRLTKLEFLNMDGTPKPKIQSGDAVRVRFHYECYRDIPQLYFGLRIYSSSGALLSDIHNWSTKQDVALAAKGQGSIDLELTFLNLMPGTYYLGLWSASDYGVFHDILENVATIDVEASDFYGTGRGIESRFGIMFFPFRWTAPVTTHDDCVSVAGSNDHDPDNHKSPIILGMSAPTLARIH